MTELIERIVDGERFHFPPHNLNEFEFWFGNESKNGMYSSAVKDGQIRTEVDTGMCGLDALAPKFVSLIVFMQNKCNAIHVGPTDEKRKSKLFGKTRGRPRKTPT